MASYVQSQSSSAWSSSLDKFQSFSYDATSGLGVVGEDHEYSQSQTSQAWSSNVENVFTSQFYIWKVVDDIVPPYMEFWIKPEVWTELGLQGFIWASAPAPDLPFEYTMWINQELKRSFLPNGWDHDGRNWSIYPDVPFAGISKTLNIWQELPISDREFIADLLINISIEQDFTILLDPSQNRDVHFQMGLWNNDRFGDIKIVQDLEGYIWSRVNLEQSFEFEVRPELDGITPPYFEYLIYDSTLSLTLPFEIHLFSDTVEVPDRTFEYEILKELRLGSDLYFEYNIMYELALTYSQLDKSAVSGIYNIWAPVGDITLPLQFGLGIVQLDIEKSFRFHISRDEAIAPSAIVRTYKSLVILDEGTNDERDVTGLINQLQINYGIKQYVGTVNIDWADPDIYHYVTITQEQYFGQFRISVYTTESPDPAIDHGKFLLERRDASLTYTTSNMRSSGRTRPALLTDPYAIPISKIWEQDLTASYIAQEIAYRDYENQSDPVTIDWRVLDYMILPGNLEVKDELPIRVISKLVNVVGGILTTDSTGKLIATYRYGE